MEKDQRWYLASGPLHGTDRRLDLVVFEHTSRSKLAQRMLRFFLSRDHRSLDRQNWHARSPDLLPAEYTTRPGIHYFQARSVTIFTENEPQPVMLDGEVATQAPMEVCGADD